MSKYDNLSREELIQIIGRDVHPSLNHDDLVALALEAVTNRSN